MNYLLARLNEPGTMRSLAVVIWGVMGAAPDDPRIEVTSYVLMALLGLWSALKPETKTVLASTVIDTVRSHINPIVVESAEKAAVQAAEQAAQGVVDKVLGGGR